MAQICRAVVEARVAHATQCCGGTDLILARALARHSQRVPLIFRNVGAKDDAAAYAAARLLPTVFPVEQGIPRIESDELARTNVTRCEQTYSGIWKLACSDVAPIQVQVAAPSREHIHAHTVLTDLVCLPVVCTNLRKAKAVLFHCQVIKLSRSRAAFHSCTRPQTDLTKSRLD
eukprot:4979722-Prymnesium_polylepis.1